MGVFRGRIHEWYIVVKIQACVTWSSAPPFQRNREPRPGDVLQQSGAASCIVIRAPSGQLVANQRIMIRGSGVVEPKPYFLSS